MKILVSLIGFLVAVNAQGGFFAPGTQEPEWSLVAGSQPKDRSYEVRLYKAAKWVSTKIIGSSQRRAQSLGFQRLFAYISKSNSRGAEIAMTTPVRSEIHWNCNLIEYTVSFYIPAEFQQDPPKPSDPTVYIEERPDFVVYARQFEGFAFRPMFYEQRLELLRALERNQVQNIVLYTFETAQYNSPWDLVGRRNEVWIYNEENSPRGADRSC
ncbi:unnamed protein product [Clavelina lepadiformis]|uniref:Heme-binding protein 2 n=1 Tax=Clavelina lepadiformis TaxID=159417 RepID=A0ABP0GSE6_CLALP